MRQREKLLPGSRPAAVHCRQAARLESVPKMLLNQLGMDSAEHQLCNAGTPDWTAA